jgi:hypothetical protein
LSITHEIEVLRRRLDGLGRTADDELTTRYVGWWPPMPQGWYWQVRWLVAMILRCLQAMRILHTDPWPATLKCSRVSAKAKPLLIWAVGVDRDTLRRACKEFSELWADLPEFAPVLVTDVADFAFFSRLGWLIEYVPELAGEGEAYDERKLTLLARLYKGAPVLPLRAGLEIESREQDVRNWNLRLE